MKLTGHKIAYGHSMGIANVTLYGRTPFFKRRVAIKVTVHGVQGKSDRQILKAAAKKTKYSWNIPFFV